MLAVKFIGKGKSIIQEIEKPSPEKGQVLIKVHTSALCGSEKKSYLSDNGSEGIPGHEMTGEIVETNQTTLLKVGDRVAINIMKGCGECHYCVTGNSRFCEQLDYQGGAHAEYTIMPEECCYKLPDDISYDNGVLLGGDTLGVAYRVLSKLSFLTGRTVLVSGAGPIGIGMITLLKYLGAYVIVTELSEYRKNFAKEKAGTDLVLDPTSENYQEELYSLTSNLGPDIIIECSGNPKAEMQALELVRCQGTVAFAGENYGEITLSPSNHIIHKEVKLMGGFYYTKSDFINLVSLYRKGLKVEQLISHSFSLDEAPEAFELFVQGKTGKVLLHPKK